MGLSGSGTQVCIFISLNRYGSLTTSMMGGFRKIFNIVLSILINGYDLTSRQSLGLTLGISGIVVNLSRNYPLFLQEIHCKQFDLLPPTTIFHILGHFFTQNFYPFDRYYPNFYWSIQRKSYFYVQ